jgi:hypothetical protein
MAGAWKANGFGGCEGWAWKGFGMALYCGGLGLKVGLEYEKVNGDEWYCCD